MQSMRRNWNQNSRGIRSENDYESKIESCGDRRDNVKTLIFFLAPSSYETLMHDLEKGSKTKKQDANSQTVKKVIFYSYS